MTPTPNDSMSDVLRGRGRLRADREPGSVEEARAMVAYYERIIATSGSVQRIERAERMLAALRPRLLTLERDEANRVQRTNAAAPPAATFEGQLQRRVRDRDDAEFEVVWDGRVR